MALINLRNALMAGKRLPYDAEVEYLEGTGTQWIDTGITPDTLDLSVELTLLSNGGHVFGCRNSSNLVSGNIWSAYSNNATSMRKDWLQSSSTFDISSTVPNTVTFSSTTNGSSISYGGQTYTGNAKTTYSYSMVLFGVSTAGVVSTGKMAIYACKIWKNGVLVRDFIPVRKGTVGYLYDRVSGKLFGNAGTGDFVVGQDVVPVEYLGSTGTQYIDTGVVPNDMTGFRVDAMARGSNDNVRVLGVYETISGQMQRFASVLRSAGSYSQEYYFGWGAAYNFTASESNLNKRRLMELNYLNSRKMAFDGAIVQSNLPALPTFTTSAYLFGNRNATPLIAMRCYQCQMSKGSSLYRSYYPVRVGTEGAMIDTLTRRIYRNDGTGAFGYGNDLKYPIPSE